MKKFTLFSICAICLSIMISCGDKFDFSTDNLSTQIEQTTALAFPLIDASLTIEKVFPEDEDREVSIIFENDGFIRLEYDYEVGTFPAVDFFNGNYSGPALPPLNYSITPIEVNLELDKVVKEGEFYLADPKIHITIKNYWDVPVRFRFQDFYYFEEENSPGIPVTGSIMSTWFSVDQPVLPAQFALTTIVMDTSNSNISDIISSLPHHMTAGAYMETIPGGSFTVNPTTIDSVSMKIDVPMDLLFSDLVLRDTSDISLGEDLGEDTSKVESVELSMIVNNGFPFGMDAQIYFTDENYLIIDSVSTQKIVISPASVAAGVVTTPTESVIKILVEDKRMNNLLKAKHLIPYIVFATRDASLGNTVKLYNNYVLGLQLGALLKLKLKT